MSLVTKQLTERYIINHGFQHFGLIKKPFNYGIKLGRVIMKHFAY
ncbi:hypothetical protein BTN50_0085 [Candidatus Enterovibrio altilux]|uniref:Uncharacterized protein n=1 Tax=Candidatus Enterovibrio altilux TaxID=1927128 RepID=A0A291B6J8_9GAMM|nr:hypothetical protein BTN50_0085 [Candidatus Enterovibrio luxaltus]